MMGDAEVACAASIAVLAVVLVVVLAVAPAVVLAAAVLAADDAVTAGAVLELAAETGLAIEPVSVMAADNLLSATVSVDWLTLVAATGAGAALPALVVAALAAGIVGVDCVTGAAGVTGTGLLATWAEVETGADDFGASAGMRFSTALKVRWQEPQRTSPACSFN